MNKERKVENILRKYSQITRGFPGRTIEQAGQIMGARKQAEVFEGDTADLIFVVNKDKRVLLELPDVFQGPEKKILGTMPKYHPVTGEVVTFRWEVGVLTENSEGRRQLENGKDFEIIGSKKDIYDLNSLPKHKSVCRLIPQSVWGGLEPAMRQQDEVRSKYGPGGVEQFRIESILASIYGLTEVFKEGKLTEGRLKEIATDTEYFLKNEGLLDARSELWKGVTKNMTLAAEKDKLARINPTRSRILARSAYLKVVVKQAGARLSQQKSDRVYTLLALERGAERKYFENAIEVIDGLYEENAIGGYSQISDREITNVRHDLKAVANSLGEVRFAPYLLPATCTRALIQSRISRTSAEEHLLIARLAVGRSQSLLNLKSVEDYVMGRDTQNATKRLLNAQEVLKSSLSDQDNLRVVSE